MNIIMNNKKIHVIDANTIFKRFFGLMCKKKITYGMLFRKCRSIHTCFMLEPIDIIVLNDKNIVIDKTNLKPFRIFMSKTKKNKTSILELPNNTSLNISINDHLIIK